MPGWCKRPTTRASSASMVATRASPTRSGANTLSTTRRRNAPSPCNSGSQTSPIPPRAPPAPPHPADPHPLREPMPPADAFACLQSRRLQGFRGRAFLDTPPCVLTVPPHRGRTLEAAAKKFSGDREKMAKKIIGIDLGTTNSVVAIMEGRDPKVIENEEGSRITPSVVGFSKDGEILVGQVARRQAITNPENTVYSIKRFMGRKFEETGSEQKRVPYRVVKGDNGDAAVEVQGKKWSPPEVSAKILQKLKRAAENYLGETVS